MDYQHTPIMNKRSRAFEIAALVCAIISAATCCCIYASYITGGLAILFAVLSKGGELTMSTMARVAFWIGIAALVLTTVFNGAIFISALRDYGSIEAILQEYCEMTGYDYNELFGELFPTH